MELQSDNQCIMNLIHQMQARLVETAADFTFRWEQDSLQLWQKDILIKHFPTPIKIGTVYNFILRLKNRSTLDTLPETITIGPYQFHPRLSRLSGEKDIVLTDKERDILVALWNMPDHSLNRDDLLDAVWAYAEGVETHTLETHIYRLRQKMETDPGQPQWLVNAGGLYRLNA